MAKIKIPEDLTHHDSTGSGMSCKFYPITKRTGFKSFFNKGDAFRCWMLHHALAEHGHTKSYVPAVRSALVQVGKKWGYAVEIVQVCTCDGQGNCPTCKLISNMSYRKRDAMFRRMAHVIATQVPKMSGFKKWFSSKDLLKRHWGSLVFDDHEFNWGSREGKPLFIDLSI